MSSPEPRRNERFFGELGTSRGLRSRQSFEIDNPATIAFVPFSIRKDGFRHSICLASKGDRSWPQTPREDRRAAARGHHRHWPRHCSVLSAEAQLRLRPPSAASRDRCRRSRRSGRGGDGYQGGTQPVLRDLNSSTTKCEDGGGAAIDVLFVKPAAARCCPLARSPKSTYDDTFGATNVEEMCSRVQKAMPLHGYDGASVILTRLQKSHSRARPRSSSRLTALEEPRAPSSPVSWTLEPEIRGHPRKSSPGSDQGKPGPVDLAGPDGRQQQACSTTLAWSDRSARARSGSRAIHRGRCVFLACADAEAISGTDIFVDGGQAQDSKHIAHNDRSSKARQQSRRKGYGGTVSTNCFITTSQEGLRTRRADAERRRGRDRGLLYEGDCVIDVPPGTFVGREPSIRLLARISRDTTGRTSPTVGARRRRRSTTPGRCLGLGPSGPRWRGPDAQAKDWM